jgi:AcrR family transcriptional regulator
MMERETGEGGRSGRARPAAERLLETAAELFYREGIRAVGVDTISEKANVSKRTLYNRFGGKDELVAEYLRRRDEMWRSYLQGITDGVVEPREKLLEVFRAYGEWLVGENYRGCAFDNAAAELPNPAHPARIVAQEHKRGVKQHLVDLASEAEFEEPETLAERLLILLEGATATAAMRRSGESLLEARSLACELLDRDRMP